MKFLGNLVWLLCGGLIVSLSWFVVGLLWCLSIVGMPWGVQCFKFARMFLSPMGRESDFRGGLGSAVLNLCWLPLGGIVLCAEAAACGLILCASIIGIPWGLQYFKIAKLALMPFGSRVVRI